MPDKIVIHGAREQNLKNINVEIPKNKLVVLTGISGSGKSSLAFDTLYAEGQRRYVESLSSYARQFLGLMEKPDVDYITGLSPAISIDQKSAGHNPRSTVGTVTEIYDYLRLLYARAGHPHCPNCGKRVKAQTVQEIVDSILNLPNKADKEYFNEAKELKIMVLGPIIKKRKGTYEELFNRLLSQGYTRVRVDNNIFALEEDIKLDRFKIHNIETIVDRLIISKQSKDDKDLKKRLTDSVETALNLGESEMILSIVGEKVKKDILYSERFACPVCDISFPEIEPHTFSFNSPYGACPKCNGLGTIKEIDSKLVYNPNLTIAEGGIFPWSRMADNMNTWTMSIVRGVADKYKFSIRTPLGKLKKEDLERVLYGCPGEIFTIQHRPSSIDSAGTYKTRYEGVIPNLERRYKQTDSDYIRHEIERYMRDLICPVCNGSRLKKESLSVTIRKKNIKQVSELSVRQAHTWIGKLEKHEDLEDEISDSERQIVKQVLKEIRARLDFLVSVGLDYLTIERNARSLSGGESQRIRLASQIGSGLSGVLYVLDEPSIGLHQKDNKKLIDTLQNLKQLDNTVIVVEHDEETMLSADHIIDIGPGAGDHGGEIVAEGNIEDIKKSKKSITGDYLARRKKIDKKEIIKKVKILNGTNERVNNENKFLELKKVSHHNLKDIDVKLPLGKFISITGVSGSGKSSLINETLWRALAKQLYGSKAVPGNFEKIIGLENIDKAVNIDQSPIGRTPRSNPATYTGLFNYIREIYSRTPEAKLRGYKMGRFSFNVKGGRCENCKGDGVIKIEMQFLPDVYVECEVCKGRRYNREALQIDYKGKNIADILDMRVEQAAEFFKNIPRIKNKLDTLNAVGLGYIKLGQQAPTLSGGESQRVKLATELSKRSTGRTIYILDEPTTGLHFYDIEKLLIVLHSLVNKGNSVVVIEHNLDVIKTADWIIDLGPEGGEKGGEIVAEGRVEDIVRNKNSYTGEWLNKTLKKELYIPSTAHNKSKT